MIVVFVVKNQDLGIENSYSIFFLWLLCTFVSAVFAVQVFFWKLSNPFHKNDSISAYKYAGYCFEMFIKSLGYPPKAFTCTFPSPPLPHF